MPSRENIVVLRRSRPSETAGRPAILARRCRHPDRHARVSRRSPPRTRGYCFTLTWKPAALRALTSSTPSKLPVTVSESVLGFAVSPVTPSTFLTAFSMALLHERQQL